MTGRDELFLTRLTTEKVVSGSKAGQTPSFPTLGQDIFNSYAEIPSSLSRKSTTEAYSSSFSPQTLTIMAVLYFLSWGRISSENFLTPTP